LPNSENGGDRKHREKNCERGIEKIKRNRLNEKDRKHRDKRKERLKVRKNNTERLNE
jgi:hypothetical protein